MRELVAIYRREDSLNMLCLFTTRILKAANLRDVLPLLGGYASLTRHRIVGAAGLAAHNLRLLDKHPGTERTLGVFIGRYQNYHQRRRNGLLEAGEDNGFDQRFEIDSQFNVKELWGAIDPQDVQEAVATLQRPLALRAQLSSPTADPNLAVEVAPASDRAEEYDGVINPTLVAPVPAPLHDIARPAKAPGLVTWDELLATARAMDGVDAASGIKGGAGWESRFVDGTGLMKVKVLSPNSRSSGLVEASAIDLVGLKHLIGLPGSGKTTILTLLAVSLANRGCRCAFMFPSIEVATAFLDTIQAYGVATGLIYGQSPSTRRKHLSKFARSMAHTNGGLGEARPTAALYPSSCSLEAFAPILDVPFPQDDPPCMRLRQRPEGKKQNRRVRCNLAALCGRLEAPRQLTKAAIWAGHITSADVQMPALFSQERVTYLELLARSFDLVVIDEADGAQSLLDDSGVNKLDMFGKQGSLLSRILRVRQRVADGGNEIAASVSTMDDLSESGQFDQLSLRLTNYIQGLVEGAQGRYQNRLVTTALLFADLYPAPWGESVSEEAVEAAERSQYYVERVFTEAVRRVSFPELAAQDNWEPQIDYAAASAALNRTPDEISTAAKDLADLMREWFQARQHGAQAELFPRIADRLKAFAPPPVTEIDAFWNDVLVLALHVGTVVYLYLNLNWRLRAWAAEGLWEDDAFQADVSSDTSKVLPESLFGRFSAVRYSVAEGNRVEVQYLTFASTPRALLYHLHDLFRVEGVGGPAVLLSSATSFLEDSPSFHIPIGPHYVLKRPNSGSGWANSKYAVLPLLHPQHPGEYLIFSGVGLNKRDAALRWMADRLLEGGALSRHEIALANNDFRHGVTRKCGWVVNSYEQARLLMEHLRKTHPEIASRTRAVSNDVLPGTHRSSYVSTSEVESLGFDASWDLLIFPMGAIGRGMNIVFQTGRRRNEAMLGSLFFLTRPHPKLDSTQFLEGLVASASMDFDMADHSSAATVADLRDAYFKARTDLGYRVGSLLRTTLMVGRLGPLARPFVADQMVSILQTIGRAMRNDCPAFAYFVDAAWAPRSVRGKADTVQTSMLVMMERILNDMLAHPNPVKREIYQELYQPFMGPLGTIDGLNRKH